MQRRGVMVEFKPAPNARAARIKIGGIMGNQEQRSIQQLRPILRAEYHVVRVVCLLTPEQRKQIARDAEHALKEVAQQYVQGMHRPMTLEERAGLDPHKLIQNVLARSIKDHLPAEQAARYQAELVRRADDRKRLCVRNLVARLDKELLLSTEQRDRLEESLFSHFDFTWGQSLETFANEYGFVPPIPDACVVPYLNDPQKKVWSNIPKQQVFWGGFGMVVGIGPNAPIEDEELREARLAEGNQDANENPRAPAARFHMMIEQIKAAEARAPAKIEKPQAKP
jgi:hypothetical protein